MSVILLIHKLFRRNLNRRWYDDHHPKDAAVRQAGTRGKVTGAKLIMADNSFNGGPDQRGPTTSNVNPNPGLSQEQLRRVNQIVLSGQLATGMVHDFNHVLTVIRGYSELLLGDLIESDAAREKLSQIRKAVDRGAFLARQLLAFGRNEPQTPVSLDVNRLIEDLQQSLGPWLAGRIELRVLLGADLTPVRFDPGQLQQVVMNLVVNARDA